MAAAIQRRNGAALLAKWRHLLASAASPEVRAAAYRGLLDAAAWLREQRGGSPAGDGFYRYQLWLIDTYLREPVEVTPVAPQVMPPGSPIG